jgi:hypothetical protein
MKPWCSNKHACYSLPTSLSLSLSRCSFCVSLVCLNRNCDLDGQAGAAHRVAHLRPLAAAAAGGGRAIPRTASQEPVRTPHATATGLFVRLSL